MSSFVTMNIPIYAMFPSEDDHENISISKSLILNTPTDEFGHFLGETLNISGRQYRLSGEILGRFGEHFRESSEGNIVLYKQANGMYVEQLRDEEGYPGDPSPRSGDVIVRLTPN